MDADLGVDPCVGSFSTGCSSGVCDYAASWVVRGNNVDFTIAAKRTPGSTSTEWVGIGFSTDRLMVSVALFLHQVECVKMHYYAFCS